MVLKVISWGMLYGEAGVGGVGATEIDTLEKQQTEKLRWKTSIGYESWKFTQAAQGGILGGHKSSPVRPKYMLSPADFISPLIKEDLLGQAAACIYFQ